jgi:hypothetical protein
MVKPKLPSGLGSRWAGKCGASISSSQRRRVITPPFPTPNNLPYLLKQHMFHDRCAHSSTCNYRDLTRYDRSSDARYQELPSCHASLHTPRRSSGEVRGRSGPSVYPDLSIRGSLASRVRMLGHMDIRCRESKIASDSRTPKLQSADSSDLTCRANW